jgi:ribosome-associated translation inhibitor RaiA
METPVEIEFQGMRGTAPIRQSISRHIAKLEDRFGRITACRIVVKAPTAHHQTGTPHNVHIRLALPDGREVNVGGRRSLDERDADLPFALNNAFKRARRALQDRVRRMRGQVKTHAMRSPPPPPAE